MLANAAPRRQLEGVARPIGALTLAAVIGLLVLPFVTTFNELLTRVAMGVGLDALLGTWVAPALGGLVHGALALFGFTSGTDGSLLTIARDGRMTTIYISWNCVGWQTLILFALSALTGLQGAYTVASRVETFVVGLLGVFLLNIARISLVAVVAWGYGTGPAIVVHDYGSLVLSVGFLFAFWAVAYRGLLVPVTSPAD